MRVKKRKIPIKIIVNDITVSRLPFIHPKRQLIIADTKKYQAGYNGERKLDFFVNLEKSNDFYNLQDLRLGLNKQFFQMDSVVLASHFILDMEVKDWIGRLKYDSINKQVLQYHGDKLVGIYQDPVSQSQQHLLQLEYWLKENNFKVPPLESLAVVTNPNTIFDFDGRNESTKKIILPHVAIEKIKEFQKFYKNPILTPKDLNAISRTMNEKHTPEDYNVLKKYGIHPDEIQPGVKCPKCNHFPMVRKHRTWYCTTCEIHSADAHEMAIIEYLLIHKTMTNKQCRDFLCLPQTMYGVVTREINRMNLPFTGITKNRIYYLPKHFEHYIKRDFQGLINLF